MKVLSHSIIYDNPLPQLRSRQAAFPFLAQLGDGTVICSYQIGEAFESVDGTSYISRSSDNGKTWEGPFQMFDKSWETTALSASAMNMTETTPNGPSAIRRRAAL